MMDKRTSRYEDVEAKLPAGVSPLYGAVSETKFNIIFSSAQSLCRRLDLITSDHELCMFHPFVSLCSPVGLAAAKTLPVIHSASCQLASRILASYLLMGRVDRGDTLDTQFWTSGDDVLICDDDEMVINKDERGEKVSVTLIT